MSIKVTSVTPLSDMRLLVTFENGVVKLFDVRPIVKDFPEYAALENTDIFNLVTVEPGGYGVSWTPDLDASEGELWENGVELPLHLEDLAQFVRYNVVNTADITTALNCSRQNVEDLVKRGKLAPVKTLQKGKLFLLADVQARIRAQPQ